MTWHGRSRISTCGAPILVSIAMHCTGIAYCELNNMAARSPSIPFTEASAGTLSLYRLALPVASSLSLLSLTGAGVESAVAALITHVSKRHVLFVGPVICERKRAAVAELEERST